MKTSLHQKLRLLIPWIALTGYWLLLFSVTHVKRLPASGIGSDKLAHYGAYLLLTLFFWWACFGRKPLRFNSKKPYYTMIVVAFYGAADEISQKFVGRSCELNDWLSDVAGMLTALIMILVLRKLYYWLVLYAGALLTLTHWNGQKPLLVLNPFFAKFHLVYVMLAFIVLTVLFWRCFCPDRFRLNKLIFGITTFAMISFALLSEFVRLAMKHTFSFRTLAAAIFGTIFAVMFCSIMAKQAEIDESYQQFPT